MDTQSIVILDFGAQYTQLIARRIREQNVFSAVLPCTASLEEIQAYKPIGIVLSGGPCSVYDADAPPADPKVLGLGVPILGICYGLQFITHHLGGKVRAADKREYGHADVRIVDDKNALFDGLPADLTVWMSHGDEALELPAGFLVLLASIGEQLFLLVVRRAVRFLLQLIGPFNRAHGAAIDAARCFLGGLRADRAAPVHAGAHAVHAPGRSRCGE